MQTTTTVKWIEEEVTTERNEKEKKITKICEFAWLSSKKDYLPWNNNSKRGLKYTVHINLNIITDLWITQKTGDIAKMPQPSCQNIRYCCKYTQGHTTDMAIMSFPIGLLLHNLSILSSLSFNC